MQTSTEQLTEKVDGAPLVITPMRPVRKVLQLQYPHFCRSVSGAYIAIYSNQVAVRITTAQGQESIIKCHPSDLADIDYIEGMEVVKGTDFMGAYLKAHNIIYNTIFEL